MKEIFELLTEFVKAVWIAYLEEDDESLFKVYENETKNEDDDDDDYYLYSWY